jgi:hypothetical protein
LSKGYFEEIDWVEKLLSVWFPFIQWSACLMHLSLKRAILVSFCAVLLCVTFCPLPGSAVQTDYMHVSYLLDDAVTVDGQWTYNTEWSEALPTSFGTNASFRSKWDGSWGYSYPPLDMNITVYVLVETWDGTDDEGDYCQVCFDCAFDNASTPQADDLLLNITGHTNAAWYVGNGADWVPTSTPDNVTWCSAKGASPSIDSQHWILELKFDRLTLGMLYAFYGMRVEVYDAHSGGLGLEAWPTSGSIYIPNDCGLIDYECDHNIPEGFSVGTVAVLVAVVFACSMCLGKRRKSGLGSSLCSGSERKT